MKLYENTVRQTIEASLKSPKPSKGGAFLYNRNKRFSNRLSVDVREVNNIERFANDILTQITQASSPQQQTDFIKQALPIVNKAFKNGKENAEKAVYIILTSKPSADMNKDLETFKQNGAVVFVTYVGKDAQADEIERLLPHSDFVFVASQEDDLKDIRETVLNFKAKGKWYTFDIFL